MSHCRALLLVLSIGPVAGHTQEQTLIRGGAPAGSTNVVPQTSAADSPVTLPAGTPFAVSIAEHLPMRVGTAVRAPLLYPVFAGSTLVLSSSTTLRGTVVALHPDHTRRVHARLNGDFTPFYTPVVRFTQVVLGDGTALPLASGDAINGAPIFRIVAPPPSKDSFLARQMQVLKTAVRDRLRVLTDPDKGDRLKQFFYAQLPYHPQRIAKETAWTVETTAPLVVPPQDLVDPAARVETPGATDTPPTWMVQAYLNDALTSASTKVGQEIKATVAEPIYNADQTVAVPQGATLVGAVTKAKPARRLARAGALSFSFRQLILPGGNAESVQTSLKGADSASAAQLAMDSEGEVKPKPQDKILVPALLLLAAARPLDRDRNDEFLGKDAVASNSLGLIGFIVGVAAQQRNLAAGIGYYGAAISIYERIFARGKEVSFARDTRIVLQTTARRSNAIKPAAGADRPR